MRFIAKLFLNSLWAKFGQRDNLTITEDVTDPKRFYELLTNNEIDHSKFDFIELTETTLEVSYCMDENYIQNNLKTNIFVALFTTAHSQLRLYEGLESLDRQVLYYDTDSIVYVYDEDEDDKNHKLLENSPMLGKFESEFPDDVWIDEFVSGGPKNYAYKLNKEYSEDPECIKSDTKCVVKGISLNFDNERVINFKSVKNMILGSCVSTFEEYMT